VLLILLPRCYQRRTIQPNRHHCASSLMCGFFMGEKQVKFLNRGSCICAPSLSLNLPLNLNLSLNLRPHVSSFTCLGFYCFLPLALPFHHASHILTPVPLHRAFACGG
jgi:hypothetical protein